MQDLSKTYFQNVWGEGYYEYFSYGVGITTVYGRCVFPFLRGTVLEIGSGGGVFTEAMQGQVDLIAIDVIKMPERFKVFERFQYYELDDKSYDCGPVEKESIDFCFSYNVFCHLSNEALIKYLNSVNSVLKPDGDFIFMISNFERVKKHVINPGNYKLGDLLDMGHFYQDLRTLDLVMGEGWEIVSRNMIPEHRDILIHLKKKLWDSSKD